MERGSLELYHAPVLLLALLLGVLDVAEYRRGKILDARAFACKRSVHTQAHGNTLILYKGKVVAFESLRNPNASLAESFLRIRIALESLWNRS